MNGTVDKVVHYLKFNEFLGIKVAFLNCQIYQLSKKTAPCQFYCSIYIMTNFHNI